MHNDDVHDLENKSAGFSLCDSQTSLWSPADGKEYPDSLQANCGILACHMSNIQQLAWLPLCQEYFRSVHGIHAIAPLTSTLYSLHALL